MASEEAGSPDVAGSIGAFAADLAAELATYKGHEAEHLHHVHIPFNSLLAIDHYIYDLGLSNTFLSNGGGAGADGNDDARS